MFVLAAAAEPLQADEAAAPARAAETAGPVRAAEAAEPLPRYEAITRPSADLALGFTLPGAVATVAVEPGDRVGPGETLASLDDSEVRLRLALLELRAASTLAEDQARAELGLARNELARTRLAAEQGAGSAFEVERSELEVARAETSLAAAAQRRREAELLLRQTAAAAEQYTLAAPIAGRVEEVGAEPGEPVEALAPILRLVRTDPLRIDVNAPVAATRRLRVGDPARVHHPSGDVSVGEVVFVGSVADAASGTRRVRISVPNPPGEGEQPAGLRVEVAFPASPSSADRAEPVSPAGRSD